MINRPITTFATGTYTVTRESLPTYDVHGRIVPGTTTTFSIVASIQPPTGAQLRVMPEGRYSDNTRMIYTEALLRTQDTTGAPDVLTIDGIPYEAFSVEQWDFRGVTHYEITAAKRATP